ncbi:hypothetical protein NHQ30_001279 [Ciborinia camelliae]|nr:hypothetical protein NHQ30_001279 [Ciborinia camelliae]
MSSPRDENAEKKHSGANPQDNQRRSPKRSDTLTIEHHSPTDRGKSRHPSGVFGPQNTGPRGAGHHHDSDPTSHHDAGDEKNSCGGQGNYVGSELNNAQSQNPDTTSWGAATTEGPEIPSIILPGEEGDRGDEGRSA